MAALYLVEDLDLQDKLRRDPSLIPQYIEEVLRYRAPSHMRARTLAADAVVDGKTLRKGERVVFLSAAANRDPEQFEEPTKFSLERPDSRHLSFGAGIHGCLGSRLARAELRIFLEELLKRPRLLLNGEAKHTPLIAAMHMGVMALPVRFLDPGDL